MKAKSSKPGDQPGAPRPNELKVDYIKSNFFRVVHLDGVHGGITPHGQICVSVWNDRGPIPQQSVFPIAADGTVGNEIADRRITREGVVREVEVAVMMDMDKARAVATWLTQKVDEMESALQTALGQTGKGKGKR